MVIGRRVLGVVLGWEGFDWMQGCLWWWVEEELGFGVNWVGLSGWT